MIEAPRDLAHELEMRDLILTHRHHVGAIDQNVGALHDRIAKETKRGEIAVGKLFLLVLVRRHALEPSHGGDHAEQQRKLGMLGNARLNEYRGSVWIDAHGKPVDEHLPDAFLDRFR